MTSEKISAGEINKLGYKCIEKKDYLNAKKFFLLAIKKEPAVKYYYNNLSVALINLKDYKNAYKYLLIAISLDPNYVKALSNMSVACFYLYKFREAYSYYQRAKRADGEYTERRFEKNKVIKRLEKIKKDDPGNQYIDLILNYLRRNGG